MPVDFRARLGMTSQFWHAFLPSGPATKKHIARAAILVSRRLDLDDYEQTQFDHPDLVSIHFKTPNTIVTCIYNPPDSNDTILALDKLLSPFPDKIEMLITGDFNKHHALWAGEEHPERNNRSDTDTLLSLIATHDLNLCTVPGTHTRYSSQHDTWSTIDLTFATNKLSTAITKCLTDEFDGHGSDHRTVIIELDTQLARTAERERLNYRATDWKGLREWAETKLNQLYDETLPSPTHEIDRIAERITDILKQGTTKFTPVAKKSVYSKRWWAKDLTAAKGRFIASQRRHKKHPSLTTKEGMLEARRTYHAKLKSAKKDHWREWLENATQQTIWQANKYANTTDIDITASRIPPLSHQGSTATTNAEKAETFKSTLFPPPPAAELEDITDEHAYEQPIEDIRVNENEVRAIIKELPGFKAPGPSGVINETIKQLSDLLTPILTELLNLCLEHGHYPTKWKTFTTVVIRKPGKSDYTIPKAYRPIALEETLGKVLEGTVARRLTYMAEQFQLLPEHQFGARPGRTTTDAIHSIMQLVKDAQRRGEVASALFLDISQAFPNVNARRLIHNLRRRRVPNNIVNFIESFAKDRMTSLAFDNHSSPPFEASNGVPQGSPLSPTLYNFYAADILEAIVDEEEGQATKAEYPRKAAYAFIDDTAFAVSSPSLRENVTKLKTITERAQRWARKHASQFDVDKFQLIHFFHEKSNKARLEQDETLRIGDVLIKPTNAAKYLGVFIDRHLRWHKHVEHVIAKGTATVLALGRLSRSSYGLPLKLVRQLYKSVVLPRIEYGADIWYEPVRGGDSSRSRGEGEQGNKDRRKGSVGTAKKLSKVQRLATIMITGGLRSTPTQLLNYHAYLPPATLHFNRIVHNAAIRIASLPPTHPLHGIWHRPGIPQMHLSPLQRLQRVHFDLQNVETIDPRLSDPSWRPTYQVVVGESREQATEMMEERFSRHIKVFSDGSGKEGNTGSAAVAEGEDGRRYIRRLPLGPLSKHTIYESEVVGILLAIDIIREMQPTRDTVIFLDNQAAVKSTGRRKHHSGQHLVLAAQEEMEDMVATFPGISFTIAWVPGHSDIEGNEWADEEAKNAAMGSTTQLYDPADIITHQIPSSVAALRAEAKIELTRNWGNDWMKSRERRRIAGFDRAPPSSAVRQLYQGCSRREASLITQLRSRHIPLAAHLFKIRAIDDGWCLRCGEPETVEHFLLDCQRWRLQRHNLRLRNGRRRFDLRSLLGNPKIIKATLNFVASTNRLPQLAPLQIAPHNSNE